MHDRRCRMNRSVDVLHMIAGFTAIRDDESILGGMFDMARGHMFMVGVYTRMLAVVVF